MSRTYHRLTYNDRQMAEKMYKAGMTHEKISVVLGVSRQTMWREWKRGYNPTANQYEAERAQQNIFPD